MVLAGPVSVAASSFFISVLIVPHASPKEYGFFAFAMLLIQLGYNISNGAAGLPLTHCIAHNRLESVRSIDTANRLVCFFFAFLSAILGIWLDIALVQALLFGLATFLSVHRWHLRSHAYATENGNAVTVSDIATAIATAVLTGWALACGASALIAVSLSLIASNMAGSGILFAKLGTVGAKAKAHESYQAIWREQARWTLLQIAATELTTNAHVYLITLVAGPAAFAPLAVAALFWRPAVTVLGSLAQIERPRLARLLHEKDCELSVALKRLRLLAFGAFLGNLLVAPTAFLLTSDTLSNTYVMRDIGLGLLFWLAITVARAIRMPLTVLIQAAGEPKTLTSPTLVAAIVSVAGSAILLALTTPIWSLAGIVAGEIYACAATYVSAMKLMARLELHAAPNTANDQIDH